MHAKGFVGAFDAQGHVDPAVGLGIIVVLFFELRRGGVVGDHHLELGGLAPRHRNQLRHPVGLGVGDVEHPRHILQHRLGGHAVKGDDLGHPLFAVAAGNVLDHFFAAINAEVGVNIGHRLALGVQKALK